MSTHNCEASQWRDPAGTGLPAADPPNQRPCWRGTLLLVLGLVAWLLLPSPVLAGYGDPGPFQAGRQLVTVGRADGTTFSAQLYYPATATGDDTTYDPTGAPYAAISFGHGYLTNPSAYRSTLEHLATWGYFVIATESALGLFPSHARYAEDLSQTLTYLEEQNSNPAFWLYQQVDTAHFGLSGHSMGGGASILAAAADLRVRALANLAAADTNPSAEVAMADVTAPSRLIAGDEDGIVPFTQTRAMFLNGNSPRQFALIDGGWHCGFVDHNFLGCDSGSMARAQQLVITRSLLTEFFNLYLQEDSAAWRQVWGPDLGADPLVTVEADSGIGLSPTITGGDALMGTVISYTLTVTNESLLDTSFAMLVEDNVWSTAPIPAQTETLAPGQSTAVLVEVLAPLLPAPTEDSALVSARRDADGGTRAYGQITTQAIPFEADIDLAGDSLVLSWTMGTAACSFDVHRAGEPYFDLDPGTLLTTVNQPPYMDSTPGVVGDVSNNYFYAVRARCGGQAADSGRLGEFDFALVPGSVSH